MNRATGHIVRLGVPFVYGIEPTGRQSRNVSLVLVVLCGITAALVTMAQDPLLLLAAATVLLLAVLALWFPHRIIVVAMTIGVFAANYVARPVPVLPFDANGLVVMAFLVLSCGAGAVLVFQTQPGVRFYLGAAAFLGALYFLLPLGMVNPAVTNKTALLVDLSGLEVAVLLGTLALCASQRGRIAVLWGWAISGAAASAAALVEMLIGRNPILDLGLRIGTLADKWADLPMRFGLRRSAVGFGHPILFGVFVGLATLATLELSRRRKMPEGWAVALIALELLGLATTLSRGPLLVTGGVLLMWAVGARRMRTWRRVVLLTVIALCIALAVWEIGLGGDIGALLTPSQSELGATSEHRVNLAKAFATQLPQAPAFGDGDWNNSPIALQFGFTLDNEGLYLLLTRGLAGFGVLTALVVVPGIAVLVSSRRPTAQKLFPALASFYLVLAGANVAYFGQLLPYVFLACGLLWSMLGEPTEARSPAPAAPG